MRVLLYCDEDSMDKDLVRALRARGVDVATALEEGMIERDDADHLDFAVHWESPWVPALVSIRPRSIAGGRGR